MKKLLKEIIRKVLNENQQVQYVKKKDITSKSDETYDQRNKYKLFGFFVNNILVATMERKYDYVISGKSQTRNRGKMVSSLRWDASGLEKIFGHRVKIVTSGSGYGGQADFYNDGTALRYGGNSHIYTSSEIAHDLNKFAGEEKFKG